MNETDYSYSRFDAIMAAGWIRDLESSDSRIHKEKVIEKALMAARLGSADAQCFLFNCYQAYNPFYVFGIRQVPETEGLTGRANPWTQFWAMLEALRTRYITGNRAREAVEQMSQQFDSEEWNMLARRVLIKDLRCGISEKTINKVVGKTEYKIPIFSCQLAQDSTDHPKKMKGIKRLECKLDGVRVLAVVSGSTVTLYSRNGKEFENFPQVADAIEDARKHFHIFDIIPLEAFQEGHWNAGQYKRLEWLESARAGLEETTCLRIMPGLDVNLDTAEGHDIMQRYAEAAVEGGFEGIMIKSLDAPYQCKRSDSWMKWKPTITVDLNIVGFEEGTGRNENRLGAIICEGDDNDRRIHVNVGSGFSDTLRDEYWASRDQLLGHLVEVQADAVTQNQDGTYSLRFPRFLRFRDFEAGEKV